MWPRATEELEKTFDTTREPRISLNNMKGHVLVRGWDKAQVHVRLHGGFPARGS